MGVELEALSALLRARIAEDEAKQRAFHARAITPIVRTRREWVRRQGRWVPVAMTQELLGHRVPETLGPITFAMGEHDVLPLFALTPQFPNEGFVSVAESPCK
jgi:hypothetical protein